VKLEGNTNLPELLLKILSLSYHHSHFWAATFDFTTFFMLSFWAWATLFLQLGCFCVDIVKTYTQSSIAGISFNHESISESSYYDNDLVLAAFILKWKEYWNL